MEKQFSYMLGLGVALLAGAGFAERKKPNYFLGLMNVDIQHSVLRVPLAIALLYGGSKQAPLKTTRAILSFVGLFYVALGAAGSVDRSVGHTLPSRLTTFDLLYHYTVGAIATWLGVRSGRMMKR